MNQRLSVDAVESALTGHDDIAYVPALVKGQLMLPARQSRDRLDAAWGAADRGARRVRLDDVQVLRRPLLDRDTLDATGGVQYLVLPDPDPRRLVEDDPDALAADLLTLPYREVEAYVAQLAAALTPDAPLVAAAARTVKATSTVADGMVDVVFRAMAGMLDSQAFAAAVDRELGIDGVPGRAVLDGWIDVAAPVTAGATSRMSGLSPVAAPPRLRAVPTRQLHITAGNAMLVPLVSMVRAIATKGAAVVKSPARATAASTLLAAAIHAADPDHPLARHLSLTYWQGGDRRVEDVLFRSSAFDRLVVWGAPETIRSVTERSAGIKTVLLNPRYGMSLVGREALNPDVLPDVAERVAADMLVGNQTACIASLVAYIEADPDEALAFSAALRDALAVWDRRLPHRPGTPARNSLRRLQRGTLADAVWFENGDWPDLGSAVACTSRPFDVSVHPMSRLAIVRPVSSLDDALEFIHPAVSTVGVYPEPRRLAVTDALAIRGVSNITPLGDAERSYPGIPHDGMRILSELVTWTNA